MVLDHDMLGFAKNIGDLELGYLARRVTYFKGRRQISGQKPRFTAWLSALRRVCGNAEIEIGILRRERGVICLRRRTLSSKNSRAPALRDLQEC